MAWTAGSVAGEAHLMEASADRVAVAAMVAKADSLRVAASSCCVGNWTRQIPLLLAIESSREMAESAAPVVKPARALVETSSVAARATAVVVAKGVTAKAVVSSL